MKYDFSMQHYWNAPSLLAAHQQQGTFQKQRRWLIGLLVASLLLAVIRNYFGIGTTQLVPLLSSHGEAMYDFARLLSMISAAFVGLIVPLLIIYGGSFIFAVFTEIPMRQILPIQIIVTLFLLVEKAVLTILFVADGAVQSLSVFSLGPITHALFEQPFVTFFFNQWSIATVAILFLQFFYLRAFDESGKRVFWLVFGLQFVIALLIAFLSIYPTAEIIDSIGGMKG